MCVAVIDSHMRVVDIVVVGRLVLVDATEVDGLVSAVVPNGLVLVIADLAIKIEDLACGVVAVKVLVFGLVLADVAVIDSQVSSAVLNGLVRIVDVATKKEGLARVVVSVTVDELARVVEVVNFEELARLVVT